MLLEKNQTLLMIGDSVTDMGRARPVGEGLHNPMGTGYPLFVRALLESSYPELNIHTINMGESGNNVLDLANRWQRDVFDLAPDWLTILIGINDVWRQFDCPAIPKTHVYLEEYTRTLDDLVARTLPRVKGILLMTPYFMETNRNDPMRAAMDRYGAAVKAISEKYGTLFLDTQALFDDLFQHMYSANVAWDRVHPNATGAMLLARGLLHRLGADRC